MGCLQRLKYFLPWVLPWTSLRSKHQRSSPTRCPYYKIGSPLSKCWCLDPINLIIMLYMMEFSNIGLFPVSSCISHFPKWLYPHLRTLLFWGFTDSSPLLGVQVLKGCPLSPCQHTHPSDVSCKSRLFPVLLTNWLEARGLHDLVWKIWLIC